MLNESAILASKFYLKGIRGKTDRLYYKNKIICSLLEEDWDYKEFPSNFIVPIKFLNEEYKIEVELTHTRESGYLIDFYIPIEAEGDCTETSRLKSILAQLENYFDQIYNYVSLLH